MRPEAPPDLRLSRRELDDMVRAGELAEVEAPPALPPARPRRGVRGTPEGSSGLDLVGPLLADGQQDQNVRNGKVHPRLYDVLRDAEDRFRPTASLIEKEAGKPKAKEKLQAWWRGYLDGLKAMSASGAEGDPTGRVPDRGLPGLAAAPSRKGHTTRELACLVCVTLRPGAPARVELRLGSGSAALDQLAMDTLGRTLDRRPLGPDLAAQRACYRFSARLEMVPPSLGSLASCGFDEVKGKISCGHPFKTSLRTEVKLVSVDYGDG